MPSINDSVTIKTFNPSEPSLADDPFTYLSRLFVYFLQNLFRDAPRGSGLRWTPSWEETELVITAEKPTCDALEKVPHVICILGGGQWANLSMDQMQRTSIRTGERQHTDLISCTMAYHCQAKNGLTARRIAWNCAFYTNAFRRLLQRQGGIHHIVPSLSIGPESPPSAYTGPLATSELVSVVVNVPFHWQTQWRIRTPAELWRSLKIAMNVNETSPMYSAGRLVPLRPPMIHGKIVKTAPIVTEPPKTAFTQDVRADSYPEVKE